MKEHNLCIRIDIEKIPPEEGCGKVHPSAETLVFHKMSPLLPGRLPTDCFWPKVAVAGRLVSDHPERQVQGPYRLMWLELLNLFLRPGHVVAVAREQHLKCCERRQRPCSWQACEKIVAEY